MYSLVQLIGVAVISYFSGMISFMIGVVCINDWIRRKEWRRTHKKWIVKIICPVVWKEPYEVFCSYNKTIARLYAVWLRLRRWNVVIEQEE